MNTKDIECQSSCAYPLKIISMDDFFLNLDNMICNRVHYRPGTCPDKSEDVYKFEQDLSDPNKATVLFIDSRNYRLSFEKSHLRLMSNLVVYDRETVFKTKRELKNFHDLLINSKHLLMHGKVEHNQDSDWKNGMLWKKTPRLKSNSMATDLLVILRSSDPSIKSELSKGLDKLMDGFYMNKNSTFEITFESIIKSFFMKNVEVLNGVKYQTDLKLNALKFNISFSIFTDQKGNFDLYASSESIHQQKFTNLVYRIKSAFTKNKKQSNINESKCSPNIETLNSTFSLDQLPSLLCHRDHNDINFFYNSLNDEQFFRIEPRTRSYSPVYENSESESEVAFDASCESEAEKMLPAKRVNRFKTYRITKSKSTNCLLDQCHIKSILVKKENANNSNDNVNSSSFDINKDNDYEDPRFNQAPQVNRKSEEYLGKHEPTQQKEDVIDEKIVRHPALIDKRWRSHETLEDSSYDYSYPGGKVDRVRDYEKKPSAFTIYKKNASYIREKSKRTEFLDSYSIAYVQKGLAASSSKKKLYKSSYDVSMEKRVKKLQLKKSSAISAYGRCGSGKYVPGTRFKGKCSPPPPVHISANGLISPPPPKIYNERILKPNLENDLNYSSKRREDIGYGKLKSNNFEMMASYVYRNRLNNDRMF